MLKLKFSGKQIVFYTRNNICYGVSLSYIGWISMIKLSTGKD